MKIKSLLLGSAVAMAAATGAARAADTVVLAPEPEPMEYVRICDVYGAGFYYIPGTETCLKFGGYFRVELRGVDGVDADRHQDDGWMTFTRFQLNTDVRSETALGTLRGYAEMRMESLGGFQGLLGQQYINQMFIELQQASGTWRLGISDTPYARFLGYGAYSMYDGSYGFRNATELSYTFTGANGFSGILALIDDGNGNWAPDVEGGVNFTQGWGSIGAIAAYDESTTNWAAKGVARFNLSSSISAGLHVLYSSGVSSYAITQPLSGGLANWSVLAHARAALSPTVAAIGHVQWFNGTGIWNDEWQIVGGLAFTPVANLAITPQLRYDTGNGMSSFQWRIRFDRSF